MEESGNCHVPMTYQSVATGWRCAGQHCERLIPVLCKSLVLAVQTFDNSGRAAEALGRVTVSAICYCQPCIEYAWKLYVTVVLVMDSANI